MGGPPPAGARSSVRGEGGLTIFVTVGTTDFDLLVRRVDELALQFDEPVLCQIGGGHYIPRHCRYFRFAPSLDEYIRSAQLVVSHGGIGCITEVARAGKQLVGVSNPDRRDHHQDDLLRRFEADGHLIWCRSLADLGDAIERARATAFAAYVEPKCRIHSVIGEYLHTRPGRVTQARNAI